MKTYKNHSEELGKAIAHLEYKKQLQSIDFKLQLDSTYESFKLVNILNQTLSEFKESSQIKLNLFQSVLSLAGGYISKKLLIGRSNTTFKNILGYVVQYGVTRFISKKNTLQINL